jgi:hypothetical protein
MVTERHLRFPILALLFVVNLVFAGTPLIKSKDGCRRGSLDLRCQPDRRGILPQVAIGGRSEEVLFLWQGSRIRGAEPDQRSSAGWRDARTGPARLLINQSSEQ